MKLYINSCSLIIQTIIVHEGVASINHKTHDSVYGLLSSIKFKHVQISQSVKSAACKSDKFVRKYVCRPKQNKDEHQYNIQLLRTAHQQLNCMWGDKFTRHSRRPSHYNNNGYNYNLPLFSQCVTKAVPRADWCFYLHLYIDRNCCDSSLNLSINSF